MIHELPKPWYDPIAYKKIRLEEAKFEAEIAKKFVNENLTRNAAGKIFQAWEALVAALAVDKRNEIENKYKGIVKIKEGKKVKRADWIIAIMPTSYLKEISIIIGGEINYLTDKAILIHQYQYNGPDKEGVLSSYRSDEIAKNDILTLINEIEKILSRFS